MSERARTLLAEIAALRREGTAAGSWPRTTATVGRRPTSGQGWEARALMAAGRAAGRAELDPVDVEALARFPDPRTAAELGR